MKTLKRILAATTLLVTLGFASEANAQVPLENFFKNPEKAGYQISPDGKYFSYMAPYKTAWTYSYKKSVQTKQPESLQKRYGILQEACGQTVIGYFI